MRSDRTLLLVGLVAGCTYQAPVDPARPTPRSVIRGEVLLTGVDAPGDTIVFVYRAADPPPPAGTGRPVGFTTIPAAAFGGGRGTSSAPYTITNLEPGTYLLRGLTDRDGDFNPLDSSTAGATCGDVAGAYLSDLALGTPGTVEVGPNDRVEGITVVVGSTIPIERPAFTLADAWVNRADALDPTTPQRFTLQATAVHAAFGPDFPLDLAGPCPQLPGTPLCDAGLDPCQTALWVHIVDADGDGLPDLRQDLPAEAGIPDVWPRVYLELLDPPEGERWTAEAIPLLTELATGTLDPIPIGQPVPLHTLSVTWLPVARHTHPGGALFDESSGLDYDLIDMRATGNPASIPEGAWSVTVVASSGQTWTLPNRLATIGVSTRPEAFDPDAQGDALIVE